MVVVPDRRRTVLVRVLEDRRAGLPADAVGPSGLGREEAEPGAVPGVARGDVLGRRQVPRLRVAVAVVGHAHRAVHVGDHRNGARVRAGCLGEGRSGVAAGHAARRVGPVQRWIDREQMRQVVPVRVREVVDPLHADRPVHLRLDRERRRVVQEQAARARRLHGAVAPDRRRGQACGQDLLRELRHRDLVVVDRLTSPNDRVCLRHHRRDQQRSDVLVDLPRVEGVARNLGERNRCARARKPSEQVEACARASHPGNEHSTRKPPCVLHRDPPP